MNPFHPELRKAARLVPRFTMTRGLARLAGFVQRLRGVPKPPELDDVEVRDVVIPGPANNPSVRVRLYVPASVPAPRAAMLWIHGGGFVIGTPEQDQANNIDLCRELGIVIAAVAYRLSPKHPFPGPMDDCYAALRWLHEQAPELGIASGRIAIGGNSAGAGLAAGLVLMAHDRGEIAAAFQLLIYPMLDDRTVLRTDVDQSRLRMWNSRSNRFGWTSYLGDEPGSSRVSEYAAPARRADLSGLPPAWIGVGTCDLFHDEDLDYARRLREAGVDCTLKVVDGAFHGFEIVGKDAAVVQDFRRSYMDAMRRALS